MFALVARIVIVALTLLAVSRFVPGISVDGIYAALIAAVVLSLLNLLVRPVLFVLTLPITILTLGLFIFILNALLFWVASSLLQGFEVAGFLPALIGALIVSVVSSIVQKVL